MTEKKRNYGWQPDLPDQRDHVYSVVRKVAETLPPFVDLRPGCSKVEHQGNIGSCVANAVVSCLEYLEIKATKTWVDLSRLFLYYEARVLIASVLFDRGSRIRDAIKVLSKKGVPHESVWPYVEKEWATKPSKEAYAAGKQHKIRDYQRLETLEDMKSCLAAGYPFVFGFSVYESFESDEVARTGIVRLPKAAEKLKGGHAVTAVGYDDSRGVFIVRNSWGLGWGDNGHFYMPYEFMTDRNLSDDFWTIRQ